MQSKRKKFWIIFGSVCFCIIAIAVIFSFVFRLKTVDIEFRARLEVSESKLEDGIKDKVLADGNFKYGVNMFFYKTDSSVASIEKQNPYIKVEQVIKYFPNVIRVYISEREMMYRVRDYSNSSSWYILDEDFKVLEEVSSINLDTESEYYKKTIEIDPSTLELSVEVGDFVTDEKSLTVKSYVNDATAGIYSRVTSFEQVSSIKVNDNDEFSLEITMNNDSGTKIIVKGKDDILKKARLGIIVFNADAEGQLPNSPLRSNTIYVEKIGGQIQARVDEENFNEDDFHTNNNEEVS